MTSKTLLNVIRPSSTYVHVDPGGDIFIGVKSAGSVEVHLKITTKYYMVLFNCNYFNENNDNQH